MVKSLQEALRRGGQLAGMLFGGSCFLCRASAPGLLCAPCRADLPPAASPACPVCALASPRGAVCGRCLSRAPSYDATTAALAYSFPADVLVHALKFSGELSIALFLGHALRTEVRAEGVTCIVPVPLSAARLRERGFNQAVEIARPLAAALGLPLDVDLCERRRDTQAQAGLPWARRGRNMRAAFACRRAASGVIAVVDDVMTTGTTLDELAATLKAAGAARVVNWVVARTAAPD